MSGWEELRREIEALDRATTTVTGAARGPLLQARHDAYMGVLAIVDRLAAAATEWRDHIPSGYEDQTGYGQVSCSCGWDSSDVLGWEQHINAAERIGRA